MRNSTHIPPPPVQSSQSVVKGSEAPPPPLLSLTFPCRVGCPMLTALVLHYTVGRTPLYQEGSMKSAVRKPIGGYAGEGWVGGGDDGALPGQPPG